MKIKIYDANHEAYFNGSRFEAMLSATNYYLPEIGRFLLVIMPVGCQVG